MAEPVECEVVFLQGEERAEVVHSPDPIRRAYGFPPPGPGGAVGGVVTGGDVTGVVAVAASWWRAAG